MIFDMAVASRNRTIIKAIRNLRGISGSLPTDSNLGGRDTTMLAAGN